MQDLVWPSPQAGYPRVYGEILAALCRKCHDPHGAQSQSRASAAPPGLSLIKNMQVCRRVRLIG